MHQLRCAGAEETGIAEIDSMKVHISEWDYRLHEKHYLLVNHGLEEQVKRPNLIFQLMTLTL